MHLTANATQSTNDVGKIGLQGLQQIAIERSDPFFLH